MELALATVATEQSKEPPRRTTWLASSSCSSDIDMSSGTIRSDLIQGAQLLKFNKFRSLGVT